MIRLLRRLWRRLFARRGGGAAVCCRWLPVAPGVDVLVMYRRLPGGECLVSYAWLTRRAGAVPPVIPN